jgi:hypothetical protein
LFRSRKSSGGGGICSNIVNQSRTNSISMLLMMVALAASVSYGQSAEDYEVYDAVIRAMFKDGITQFDMKAKIDQIVIRDRTFSKYARGDKKEDWEHVKRGMRSLSEETISGYESARKNESELKAKLDIPYKYQLISDKQLVKVVPHPNGPFEHWAKFYKQYPNSAGYNSFSRVGYDKAKRNALVYFVNWCGSACGTGTYLLLEKGEHGWVVKETAGMWIS